MRARFEAWRCDVRLGAWLMSERSRSTLSGVFPAEVREHILRYIMQVQVRCLFCNGWLYPEVSLRIPLAENLAYLAHNSCLARQPERVQIEPVCGPASCTMLHEYPQIFASDEAAPYEVPSDLRAQFIREERDHARQKRAPWRPHKGK